MGRRTIKRLKRARSGIPLGMIGKRIIYYNPNRFRWFVVGHHLVIAATRGGKGISAVLPALIDWTGAVIVLDVKSELYAMTARYRRSMGMNVVVLNPFRLADGASFSFNALTWVRDGQHQHRDIMVITEALIEMPLGEKHFATVARLLLAAVIHVVCDQYSRSDERRTLLTVAAIIRDADFRETLTHWAANRETYGAIVSENASSVIAAGDREFGSFVTTLATALSWLDEPGARDVVRTSDFDLDDLLKGTLDVYVICPLDALERMRPWTRMMITLASTTLTRQDGRTKPERPVLLMLDEFARLGRLEVIEQIATVSAGFGITMMLIAQSRTAITSVYSEASANTLISSAAVLRVFGLGTGDVETAQWLSSCLSERVQLQGSRTLNDPSVLGGARSEARGYSEQFRPLMTPGELLQLDRKQVVTIIRGHKPILLKQIMAPLHKAYRKKLDEFKGGAQ